MLLYIRFGEAKCSSVLSVILYQIYVTFQPFLCFYRFGFLFLYVHVGCGLSANTCNWKMRVLTDDFVLIVISFLKKVIDYHPGVYKT